MTELGPAIDLFLGDLARRGRSVETRRAYRRILNLFADRYEHKLLDEITEDDCALFLNRWTGASASTMANSVTFLSRFFLFLWRRREITSNPMERIERPPRKRPEDLDVITVSSADVLRLIEACETWQEVLCLATAIYLGARRGAIARVRRRDADLVRGTVRFLEKGGKPINKPVPDEYLALLREADESGTWASSNDYLVPNRRPASVRRRERSDKVIWETIRRVATRADVRTHVHALRAAFAVQFDEQHPERLIDLKELMGHARIETTLVYLRRKNKARAMETVRDLSWGVLPPQAQEAHTGFEPVLPATALSEPFRRKLAEIKVGSKERVS